MKVNFKRVATAALAVAMSLSLSVPAFAEVGDPVGNQTLTVNGAQLKGKNVTIVKMFDATITGAAEENKYEYADYELIDAWDNFFTTDTSSTPAGIGLSGSGDALSEAAVEYIQDLEDNAIATFADKAQTWYRAKKDTDLSSVTTLTEEGVEGDTVTFNSVEPGYYLVFPEGGSTGNDGRNTDAILVNVPSNEYGVTVNIKSTFPTVDKKVDTNETVGDIHDDATDNGSAQVGDTVTFTLTSKVPDMSDYQDEGDTFYFAFHDTLTKGLEFVEGSVSVTIGTVSNDALKSSYQVTEPAQENGNKLDIVFKQLNKVSNISVGDIITVTYKAKITEDAVSGSGSIVGNAENDVYLEYSNDPTTDTKGESTHDKSKVYTYDITVDKYELVKDAEDSDHDGSKEDMIEQGLAGATFVLSTSKTLEGTGPNTYTNAIAIKTAGNNTYKVDPTGSTYEFTTVANADITIEGLEAGTYYLHEIEAPSGYNKLKAPIKVEVIVDPVKANERFDDDEPNKYDEVSFTNPLYVVNGTANATANDATIKVENKKGIELPETGSIGTIGLTALGVVVVVAGLFAFPRKKKNRQD